MTHQTLYLLTSDSLEFSEEEGHTLSRKIRLIQLVVQGRETDETSKLRN